MTPGRRRKQGMAESIIFAKKFSYMSYYSFADRHNGPDPEQVQQMLQLIGVDSTDELIRRIVPSSILLKEPLAIPAAQREFVYLKELRKLSFLNKSYKSYIGAGYYNCITPGVILRNIFENPGWYTAYTPYQAEIAQGRMEALLNFQTMVCELTAMPLANASLLDEGTAAAEAMSMFFHTRVKEKQQAVKFFVADDCFAQTIDVLKSRAIPLGIDLVTGAADAFKPGDEFFGCLLQYPNVHGEIKDYRKFISRCHEKHIAVVVAADLLSLCILTPPGEWGADAVVGTTQRFGVPLGYGGPHAAYFATRDTYKRDIPGRIIGMSVDTMGKPALRMALQTREQHIRRDKATSNICTAQVLLAVMAGMYAVYHGPKGLRAIAMEVHQKAVSLAAGLKKLDYPVAHDYFFDTVRIHTGAKTENIRKEALEAGINFLYAADAVTISVDETTDAADITAIIHVFAKAGSFNYKKNGVDHTPSAVLDEQMPFLRKSEYLSHQVFNSHHSETEMLRYIKKLENRDLALNHSMIPLGSCTMKLNASSEMIPLSWAAFSQVHPFTPLDQVEGYQQMIHELEKYLAAITGFSGVSLQPNSGAQGEYAGLMVIHAYHKDKGEGHRDVVLIPSSAHGTNPASAVMAGLKVVVVKCDENGNIDMKDLQEKAMKYKSNLSSLMVTYPSTHGVYEESIMDITRIVHEHGGQVYMDGANMNAQVGLTNPYTIGADVCHLNLHKTFAIPHGGGGPGMGPICVAEHLVPYLPAHPLIQTGGEKGTHAVSAAPWGSASILLISYAYIKMLGGEGVRQATILAMLNANYIKTRLEQHYPVLYKGKNGFCAHEMILDCRQFKNTAGIEVTDIAKRLMDYGFHAPTVSFPVAGTLMIEPTESESLHELDRFCDAMISIRKEIEEIENGVFTREDNALVNSPHTVNEVTADEWKHAYSRSKAAFPLSWVAENKFWPSVKRVDNAYGDRNLICTCPAIEEYAEA